MAIARQRIHGANGPHVLLEKTALAVFILSVLALLVLLAP
jgi:hypothetical protein